jgi:hypothetical protein
MELSKNVEVPRAYVVLESSATEVTEKAVKEYLGTRLAGYKRLDGGMFLK